MCLLVLCFASYVIYMFMFLVHVSIVFVIRFIRACVRDVNVGCMWMVASTVGFFIRMEELGAAHSVRRYPMECEAWYS